MFSNSIHRLKRAAFPINFILILVLGAVIVIPFSSFSISLPDKIGRLNDYGNVLTMEDQGELRRKLTKLKEKNIGLTLLISTHDPYLNPDIYASKIRAKWDILGGGNESFLVFVREKEEWSVRTFYTANLLNLFSATELKNYQQTLREKAEKGEIRSGTIYAVNTIYRKAFPPKKETTAASTGDQNSFPLIYLIGSIAGGLVLLLGLIRWEAMRRCPQCGSRMEISRSGGEFGGETVKDCPECGYRETK